ncbi:MAG: hypothetical protein AAF483_30850, partial [Planctomycetota bacterium]
MILVGEKMHVHGVRLASLFTATAIVALGLTYLRIIAPMQHGQFTVAHGAKPYRGILLDIAKQLMEEGFEAGKRPGYLSIDGPWQWYRNPSDDSVIVAICFDERNCQVSVVYQQKSWMDIDEDSRSGRAGRNLARRVAAKTRALLRKYEEKGTRLEIPAG